MTIEEAVAKKISKIRKPFWIIKEDYLLLELYPDGTRSAIANLYSPTNEIIGQENPKRFLFLDDGKNDWEEAK